MIKELNESFQKKLDKKAIVDVTNDVNINYRYLLIFIKSFHQYFDSLDIKQDEYIFYSGNDSWRKLVFYHALLTYDKGILVLHPNNEYKNCDRIFDYNIFDEIMKSDFYKNYINSSYKNEDLLLKEFDKSTIKLCVYSSGSEGKERGTLHNLYLFEDLYSYKYEEMPTLTEDSYIVMQPMNSISFILLNYSSVFISHNVYMVLSKKWTPKLLRKYRSYYLNTTADYLYKAYYKYNKKFIPKCIQKKLLNRYFGYSKLVNIGGWKLNSKIEEWLLSLDFNFLSSYGSTEYASISLNFSSKNYIQESVGCPIKRVKILDDEILVSLNPLFVNRYKDEEFPILEEEIEKEITTDLSKPLRKGDIIQLGDKYLEIQIDNFRFTGPESLRQLPVPAFPIKYENGKVINKWYKTGDRGFLLSGILYVEGRLKNYYKNACSQVIQFEEQENKYEDENFKILIIPKGLFLTLIYHGSESKAKKIYDELNEKYYGVFKSLIKENEDFKKLHNNKIDRNYYIEKYNNENK